MKVMGPKDPAEVKVLTFDFTKELGTATLVSATTTASVTNGEDPTPANLISGEATVSGQKAYQKVSGGLHGVIYKLRCTAVDSDGGVHVIVGGLHVETL